MQNGPVLWATVACTVLLGVVGLTIITVIERSALRWHVSQRQASAPNAATSPATWVA